MIGCEGISGQVGYLFMDLVVPCHDETEFLQSSAWEMDNVAQQPSHQEGIPGKSTPQRRNSAYLHSCTNTYILLSVDGRVAI